MSFLIDTDICSAYLKNNTAVVGKLTMVTHNIKDYANIPGLTLVDWLGP
jgi:predicted nucleic acid-binding protein